MMNLSKYLIFLPDFLMATAKELDPGVLPLFTFLSPLKLSNA